MAKFAVGDYVKWFKNNGSDGWEKEGDGRVLAITEKPFGMNECAVASDEGHITWHYEEALFEL